MCHSKETNKLLLWRVLNAVQFSSPGLTWCQVQALQDHETVINVIHAVVAETEKFSEVAGMKRERAAWR